MHTIGIEVQSCKQFSGATITELFFSSLANSDGDTGACMGTCLNAAFLSKEVHKLMIFNWLTEMSNVWGPRRKGSGTASRGPK